MASAGFLCAEEQQAPDRPLVARPARQRAGAVGVLFGAGLSSEDEAERMGDRVWRGCGEAW